MILATKNIKETDGTFFAKGLLPSCDISMVLWGTNYRNVADASSAAQRCSYLAVGCGGSCLQVQHVGAEIEQSCCCLLHWLQDSTDLYFSLDRSDGMWSTDAKWWAEASIGKYGMVIYTGKRGEGSKKVPVQYLSPHPSLKSPRLCRPLQCRVIPHYFLFSLFFFWVFIQVLTFCFFNS